MCTATLLRMFVIPDTKSTFSVFILNCSSTQNVLRSLCENVLHVPNTKYKFVRASCFVTVLFEGFITATPQISEGLARIQDEQTMLHQLRGVAMPAAGYYCPSVSIRRKLSSNETNQQF